MRGQSEARSTHRCLTREEEGREEGVTRQYLFAGETCVGALVGWVAAGSSAHSRSSCICQRGLARNSQCHSLVETEEGRVTIRSTASGRWRSSAMDSCPNRLRATERCLEAQAVAVGLGASKLTFLGRRLSCQTASSGIQTATGTQRWARWERSRRGG